MTDKERLEEIKEKYLVGIHILSCTYAVGDDSSREGYSYILTDEDYHWLIQQAELAEQSEEENDELAERVHKLALDWSELVDERNRYKQALEEISNADWNSEGLDAERELDKVTDVARKALEGEK